MSEFRQNLATKEWVILSPERSRRPNDISKESKIERKIPEYEESCPFCRGHEDQTTAPVYVFPNESDWQVRVVHNKFAALNTDTNADRKKDGRFLSAKGFGIAEVVIEHPQHNMNPALMSISEVTNILTAYKKRQIAISKDERINLITIFRNHGAKAGTSLQHPHSQVIATPIVPPHVRYPMEQAVHHYDMYGRCVYCEMVAEEILQDKRILINSENFVAFCPYASRSPYECRIYPKKHIPSFSLLNEKKLVELAGVLKEVLQRLYIGLDNPDYNYIIRSSPLGDEDTRHLHWYMLIVPKESIQAGFEIGSGIFINTVAPEDAKQFLLSVSI